MHACADEKWAGERRGKIRLGTLDRFSCQRSMRFVGYAARAQLRSAIKNKLQSSSKQIWSNALERTNHHDDTLPLAPVQLVEKKRKKAVTK